MKKSIIFITLLLTVFLLKAQVINKEVTSKVKDVTIYMNGAQITQVADLSLDRGEYNLVFTGISPSINQKSVQVTANNDVKVTSVTYSIDYLEVKSENIAIQTLKDTLKLLKKKITSIENELSVLVNEKDLILKNDDIKGQSNGIQVTELQKKPIFIISV